jgi:hypothetical protein
VANGLEEEGMFALTHNRVARMLERSLVAALLATGLALVMVPVAKAGEIIPSLAWTKTPDASGDAAISYGLAAWCRCSMPRSASTIASRICSMAWSRARSGR